MAAQRVQKYLEKHKIGPLFESLMARVIEDTPDDPVGYIIRILQEMHEKQRIVRDLDDHIQSQFRLPSSKSRQRSSHNELNGMKPRRNNLAASWSAGGPQISSKLRDYPRPWTSNSKLMENKTWSPAESGKLVRVEQSQPTWNDDTRVPTHDFDEWFQMENGPKQTMQELRKEKYLGVKSWGGQDKATREKTFGSGDSQLSGDDLKSELKVGGHRKSRSAAQETDKIVSVVASRSRPVKAKRAVEEHRQQLQALLLEDGIGKTKELKRLQHSPEEGVEILESMEELREEGITTASKRGAKLNKSKRNKTEENVSVTICARCARIIGGRDEEVSSQGESISSRSPFDDITRKENDFQENFDSASEGNEIVKPVRRTVWPMASDSESEVTPRNSKVMFKQRVKSSSPNERQFSRVNTSSPEPSSRPSTSRSSHDVPRRFLNSQRQSWTNNSYLSDNETDVRASRPSSLGSMNGRPWDIPLDNSSNDESNSSGLQSTEFDRLVTHSQRSRNFASGVASSVDETDY